MVKNVFKKLGKKQKNNKGFSLVELIVVIAIMAVLVGVLAPQLIKYVEKSREATDIQTCDNIATALKTYYADEEVSASATATTVTVTLAWLSMPDTRPYTDFSLLLTHLPSSNEYIQYWHGQSLPIENRTCSQGFHPYHSP